MKNNWQGAVELNKVHCIKETVCIALKQLCSPEVVKWHCEDQGLQSTTRVQHSNSLRNKAVPQPGGPGPDAP